MLYANDNVKRNAMKEIPDDGTLACLRIPKSDENKHFNCEEITQQKLINLTFYLIDFIDGIDTKYGKDRMIVDSRHYEQIYKKLWKR